MNSCRNEKKLPYADMPAYLAQPRWCNRVRWYSSWHGEQSRLLGSASWQHHWIVFTACLISFAWRSTLDITCRDTRPSCCGVEQRVKLNQMNRIGSDPIHSFLVGLKASAATVVGAVVEAFGIWGRFHVTSYFWKKWFLNWYDIFHAGNLRTYGDNAYQFCWTLRVWD